MSKNKQYEKTGLILTAGFLYDNRKAGFLKRKNDMSIKGRVALSFCCQRAHRAFLDLVT